MGSLQPFSPLGPRPCWVCSPLQPVGGCCRVLLTQHVVPGVCVVSLWLSSPQLVTAGVVLGSSLARSCCELPLPFVCVVWAALGLLPEARTAR